VRLQVLAQRAVLDDEPPLRERVAKDGEHLVVLERLADVVEGAALHRRDRALDRRERGDHENRQIVVELLQFVERLDAVHPRQHHVHDRGVERDRARQLEAFLGTGRQADLIALARQQRVEDLPHDLLVVDDEYGVTHMAARPASAIGRRIEKRVPCPRWLSQLMVPPCSCTMP
jgi:hypothetical protein